MNIEVELTKIQQDIVAKIQHLLTMSNAARRELAETQISANKSSFSSLEFRLAQRIPLLRMFVGHAPYDVHQNKDHISIFSKMVFYLTSYLNLHAWGYLFNWAKSSWAKSVSEARSFIVGEAQYKILPKAYWQLLKGCLLLLWLPFIGAYASASTLSSLPFLFLRKIFGVTFGKKVDKGISFVESIKDVCLLAIAIPLSYLGLTAIGSACLGAVGLELGSFVISGILMACWSPVLLLLSGTLFDTYPGWVRRVSRERAVYIYREQSEFSANMEVIRNLSTNAFARIHAFLLGVTFITFSLAVVIGFGVNKFYQLFASRFNSNAIRQQTQNLNHTQKFREFLADMVKKMENASLAKSDKADLIALNHCVLSHPHKKLLKDYLNEKLADESTPEKSTLRIALQYIDKESYLPSCKLVTRVKSELNNEQNSVLKEALERVESVYANQLKNYI